MISALADVTAMQKDDQDFAEVLAPRHLPLPVRSAPAPCNGGLCGDTLGSGFRPIAAADQPTQHFRDGPCVMKLNQALVRNVRTWPAMLREKVQAARTARPKVPMRRRGADCLVVVKKRGNARGAKGAGHRHWIGPTGNGRSLIISGRRQPSCDGTSRMNREVHVRIWLGVRFPGPTRHELPSAASVGVPIALVV
jgi:hypothetical protein